MRTYADTDWVTETGFVTSLIEVRTTLKISGQLIRNALVTERLKRWVSQMSERFVILQLL